MRKILKNALVLTLVTGLCLSFVGMVSATEPTITVDPAAPVSQGEVTFTATVDDENVISVYIVTQECDETLCYPDTEQNLTMTDQGNGTYKATTNLIRTGMYYVQYTLYVETSEGWIEYLKNTKTYLAEDGNGSTNGGNGGDNGTPGFELILILVSIVVALSIYKRKR